MNDSLKQDNFKDVINFKKDAVLFIEGEASSFMYIIAKGRIGILKENDGKVMPLAIVGEIFVKFTYSIDVICSA